MTAIVPQPSATEVADTHLDATTQSTADSPAADPDVGGQVTVARRIVTFALHYLEMVIAMVIGMIVLGPIWNIAWPGYTARVETMAGVMALDMTVAMAAWMGLRRHSPRGIVLMSAAMVTPFVGVLAVYRLGLIPSDQVLTWSHVLMLALMALVMLLPSGHARHHRRRG
ncbi:hypothetical protein [Microlunatus ginsengisoli]|uniref:Flagellar biosynthetic protein FliP n=1 Tax=Microlunatus ginsengisoli TaxID=363863 RepID=A0ABP7AC67_9ACTN